MDEYYAPAPGPLSEFKAFIKNLPPDENPRVFGLHPNAMITAQINQARKFLDTVIAVQPRIGGGGGGKKPEEIVAEIAEGFEHRVPEPMNVKLAHPSTFEKGADGGILSLGVFFGQEVDRFNALVVLVKTSLHMLGKAIKGLVVMSADLEDMFNGFMVQKIPKKWADVAYPCLKPLGSWVSDFIARVKFMNSWLTEGPPISYWLPAFFFPQGFMTACMQMHARKSMIPIDTLKFKTQVTKVEDLSQIEEPAAGVNIYGLFLQGAGWNVDSVHLQESNKGVLFLMMPVIQLVPVDIEDPEEACYDCPLYKTSTRSGTLSTTGHSTNFVLFLSLPRGDNPSNHWIRRGVALLCMLDD